MSTSTFRETVALVAARAKEKLPVQVNGRIESAVKLVLAHDVTLLDDGTIEVGSSSDPLKTYHLVGPTCTCTDFTQGRAPESWCKHRIAAGIDKRVRELLPVVPELVEPWADNDPGPLPELEPEAVEVPADPQGPAPAPLPEALLPEAALSLTLKGALGGIEAMLTIRGQTPAEFQRNLQAVKGLLDAPASLASPPLAPPPPVDPAPQCPQHGALKPSTKGQGWYCPHKRDDGTWCTTKAK